MLQISKKVEYGLIAIRHLATQPVGVVATAKELAERYHISYELMAKVLQKLTKERLILSHHGVRGGYTLGRSPNEIRVSEILNAIEGKPNITMVQCEAESLENCSIHTTCTIKDPMVKIQGTINSMFERMTVSELV